jgi:hypothetical protein
MATPIVRLSRAVVRAALAGVLGVALAGVALPGAAAAAAGRAPAAAPERVLFSFGGPDGAGPLNGLIRTATGAYFGATVFGGKYGGGAAYQFTLTGTGGQVRVLHSFGLGSDGNRPDGIVAGPNGALYGVTVIGGAPGWGTAFELAPSGHGYTERIIHTFAGGTDGGQPLGPLAIDGHGDLFGVTQFRGTSGYGTVFELSPSAHGFGLRVLHDFAVPEQAQAGLTLGPGGVLYGTTYSGGTGSCVCGTVYALTPRGTGYHYSVLHDFQGGSDGSNPFALLTIDPRTGEIYGTTEYGGGGYGSVFRLTPAGRGYTEQVIHGFPLGSGGGTLPQSPLTLLPGGRLVGTAALGGHGCHQTGCGTVFELSPVSGGYRFAVLHVFAGPPGDGAEPEWTSLVAGPGGELLGATRSGGTVATCGDGGPGGAAGCGTVFAITPAG